MATEKSIILLTQGQIFSLPIRPDDVNFTGENEGEE
jgi:hypothetical protein